MTHPTRLWVLKRHFPWLQAQICVVRKLTHSGIQSESPGKGQKRLLVPTQNSDSVYTMVNFMCQLDCTKKPRCLVKHHSGCVCEGVSQWGEHWISRPDKADCPPNVAGWHPINWRPEEKKIWVREYLLPAFQLECQFSSAFGLKKKHQLFLGLKSTSFRTGTTIWLCWLWGCWL